MKPNLFVLGASRCGTTSLHTILGQHPDVHASKYKEPTFFIGANQATRNPIEYFKLFDSPKRYRLESSVAYFSNPETAPVLRDLFPDARFIISLRDPKARAYALYRLMKVLGHEDIPNFAGALEAEEYRSTSQEFLYTCNCYVSAYLYCRSSLFDEQLARYFGLFNREQFHIITLAELATEPVVTTEGILRFLDLDPTPAQHFDFTDKWCSVSYEPWDGRSDQIMTLQFEGVSQRTDQLVGRSLDWSL